MKWHSSCTKMKQVAISKSFVTNLHYGLLYLCSKNSCSPQSHRGSSEHAVLVSRQRDRADQAEAAETNFQTTERLGAVGMNQNKCNYAETISDNHGRPHGMAMNLSCDFLHRNRVASLSYRMLSQRLLSECSPGSFERVGNSEM